MDKIELKKSAHIEQGKKSINAQKLNLHQSCKADLDKTHKKIKLNQQQDQQIININIIDQQFNDEYYQNLQDKQQICQKQEQEYINLIQDIDDINDQIIQQQNLIQKLENDLQNKNLKLTQLEKDQFEKVIIILIKEIYLQEQQQNDNILNNQQYDIQEIVGHSEKGEEFLVIINNQQQVLKANKLKKSYPKLFIDYCISSGNYIGQTY